MIIAPKSKTKKYVNILHCIYDSPNNKWINGGGAYRTIEIYKRFPNNYKITILTGNHPNKKLKIKNIKFIYIGFKLNYFLSRISYMFMARRYIRQNHYKYDLVIEDFTPYTPLKSYKYNNSILILQNYFGKNLLKKFYIIGGIFAYFNELKMISKFKYKIFSSHYLKKIISSKIKNIGIYKVIPYGIDKKLFALKKQTGDYILYLGRMEFYQKGLDILIEVMKDLPQIKLVIAGSGKDENLLLKKIKNFKNISYVGRIDKNRKYNYIKNSSIVVMPSRYESFGIVAIEAAAAGKPVIGTKNTGLQETILHNKTGILLNLLTKENLKSAILKLCNNKKLLIRLGKEGKNFAKNFSWNEIYKKQLSFYNKILTLKND